MYGQTAAVTGGAATIFGLSAGWEFMAAGGILLLGSSVVALVRPKKKGLAP